MASTGVLLPAGDLPCNTAPQKPALEACDIRNPARLITLFSRFVWLSHNTFRYGWACNTRLAQWLRCSTGTITRAVARLVELGAVAVEHLIGKERRVRPLITLDELKIILFRGHESHRTQPEKAEKKAEKVEKAAKSPGRSASPAAATAAPAPSFCPPVAEGVADTLAEGVAQGPKEVSATQIPSHSSYEEKTTTDIAPEALPKTLPPTEPTAPVVVPSPRASGDQPDPQLVALVAALGIPERQVPRLIAHKSAVTVRQAVGAVRFYLTRDSGNPGALLAVALRDGWTPPATSEHASDHGARPVHIVRSPREYLDRVAASALEAPRMPVEAPIASPAGDSPSGGREAFRMAIRRLRSTA